MKNDKKKLTKKPSLDYNSMSPFHAYIIKKKKKNPNLRGISKQTYSSFIMKMLDETPINFNKTIKKISVTTYKNLLKKSTVYKPFDTNYSNSNRNNVSPFAKKLNKDDSKIITKREDSKESNNKSNIQSKKVIFHKFNNNNLNFNKSNVSPNKEIKVKNSFNNIRRRKLNHLYGYDSNFIKSKNHLLKKKDSFELETYQNEVLKVSKRNLSKDYMMKLCTELQFIKNDADLVKPLPPINYHALVTHCFKEENDKINNKKKKSKVKKGPKKMDEYEKELYKIKTSYKYKRVKTQRNKTLYKVFEILPEYVIDALYKKRNRPTNI